ncbi:hypothetical protein ABPG75_011649 [Micractinium tetrahymenae]
MHPMQAQQSVLAEVGSRGPLGLARATSAMRGVWSPAPAGAACVCNLQEHSHPGMQLPNICAAGSSLLCCEVHPVQSTADAAHGTATVAAACFRRYYLPLLAVQHCPPG